jgi:hypothetical protein
MFSRSASRASCTHIYDVTCNDSQFCVHTIFLFSSLNFLIRTTCVRRYDTMLSLFQSKWLCSLSCHENKASSLRGAWNMEDVVFITAVRTEISVGRWFLNYLRIHCTPLPYCSLYLIFSPFASWVMSLSPIVFSTNSDNRSSRNDRRMERSILNPNLRIFLSMDHLKRTIYCYLVVNTCSLTHFTTRVLS